MSGWQPDPTGRFGQRWHDGATWTEHVLGANGQPTSDPLPDVPSPAPPGPVLAPPSPYDATPSHPVERVRSRPGAGLAVGLVGVLLTSLSLLGLPWGDGVSFLDLSEGARSVDASASGDPVVWAYVGFLAFVLLALTAILLVLASATPASRGVAARLVGTVAAGLGAVLHAVYLAKFTAADVSLDVGAWLGLAGFLVAGLGIVLGARRVPG